MQKSSITTQFSVSGSVYYVDEKGTKKECFQLDSSIQQLLYFKEKDYLVAVAANLQVRIRWTMKCIFAFWDIYELPSIKKLVLKPHSPIIILPCKNQGQNTKVSQFYSRRCPCIRLVNGPRFWSRTHKCKPKPKFGLRPNKQAQKSPKVKIAGQTLAVRVPV